MGKRLSVLKPKFEWKENAVGEGMHCVYYPILKIYLYLEFDDRTDEFLGYKYLIYFCDASYHCTTIFEEIEECKQQSEESARKIIKKVIKKLYSEGSNEYSEV